MTSVVGLFGGWRQMVVNGLQLPFLPLPILTLAVANAPKYPFPNGMPHGSKQFQR